MTAPDARIDVAAAALCEAWIDTQTTLRGDAREHVLFDHITESGRDTWRTLARVVAHSLDDYGATRRPPQVSDPMKGDFEVTLDTVRGLVEEVLLLDTSYGDPGEAHVYEDRAKAFALRFIAAHSTGDRAKQLAAENVRVLDTDRDRWFS